MMSEKSLQEEEKELRKSSKGILEIVLTVYDVILYNVHNRCLIHRSTNSLNR